ncbi:hypothetical protein CS063_00305 [Sporanaerobium hydrogeniformans]|uniref:Uncharacterized protein n=1 Tax=Sporanaerobium hydrogeniformans TaxID=3072179 RepID=A0AC61DGJ9_9FIRM|nr:hypothetical protein [Sporanaerobium hydrogeniformans]PHV71953.1 hypothetical protein CS063_00305 [Sporanaerobium hydrogeniformans]
MEDIIKEIIKIDTVAVDTKKKSEMSLREKQLQYENEMKTYKESVMDAAEKKAEEQYNQIVEIGKKEYDLEEEKAKEASLLVANKYLKVEARLLDQVFNELFKVEG